MSASRGEGADTNADPFSMARRTDAELREILNAPEDEWRPEAIAAAREEVTRRAADAEQGNEDEAKSRDAEEARKDPSVIGLLFGVHERNRALRKGDVARAKVLEKAMLRGIGISIFVMLLVRSCHLQR